MIMSFQVEVVNSFWILDIGNEVRGKNQQSGVTAKLIMSIGFAVVSVYTFVVLFETRLSFTFPRSHRQVREDDMGIWMPIASPIRTALSRQSHTRARAHAHTRAKPHTHTCIDSHSVRACPVGSKT